MSLEKELAQLLQKYGMKADDAGAGNGAAQSDSNDDQAGAGHTAKSDTTVVADLADSIAAKLTKAISEAKGYKSEETQDSLQNEIKTKIFTNWGGMKEVSYPSDVKSLSKDEKIVTFFKALVFSNADPNAQRVLRALVEGTPQDGGYLVPEELRTEVFRVLPDRAVMRRIARTLPMSSDTLLLNSLTAAPKAYWTAEYASKSTTSAEFGQVSLTPNDLVCLLPVSEQLLADANINLVQFIIGLFSEAIATAEDKAFFTGSGSGQPKGISQENLTTTAAGGALTFDHILAALDRVPQQVTQSNGAAFVGNRAVRTHLRQLKDTVGNYIWRDGRGGVGGGQEIMRLVDTLYGYPFYEQNDLSEDELYFGDWRNYIIGDRQVMTVRTTTEGGESWRRNSMEIKAVERVDGKAVLTRPFTKITGIQS